MRFLFALILAVPLVAADYHAPAGTNPAVRRPGGETVLPGGRLLRPAGLQYITGPGPFGLAMSPNGQYIVSADGGPDRFSLTVIERGKKQTDTRRYYALPRKPKNAPPSQDPEEDDWYSAFMGLAFESNHILWASEGNSGRVRRIDVRSGKRQDVVELDRGGFRDSYSGDLALDAERGVLWALDQANFRIVGIDIRKKAPVSSLRLGRIPFTLALSPDKRRAYVTNLGMFEYKAIPGADRKRARETGLPFPAFGFPSPEARDGARRETAAGRVAVPGLGDPNVPESNSLAVVNLDNPAQPRLEKLVPVGKPFGGSTLGGSSPSGVAATRDRIYVSNAANDSVSVIDAATLDPVAEIPLRIRGLDQLRGVMPLGLAVLEDSNWLLAAEAGINAVGVIDMRQNMLVGHIPVGWFPTRVLADRDHVYVTNSKGQGTGPNADRASRTVSGELRRGSVTIFPVPDAVVLHKATQRVYDNNGFNPGTQLVPPPSFRSMPLPAGVRYVVIIVKENRTFDEVFGDMTASNGAVAGDPELARYGERAPVASERGELRQRFSPRFGNVTPNHHEMARRWAFSDNFYADSEVSVDGHHWIVGAYPNAWTESSLMAAYGGQKDFRLPTTAPGRLLFAQSNSSVHPEEQPEAGTLWHHLERNGITFRNFGEGFELAGVDEGPGLAPTGARYLTNVPMPDPLFRNTSREYPQYNMNIPDQYRATQFIKEIEQRYREPKLDLPRLLFLHLPNDHTADPRPADGYPFRASYVADNDLALGRIVEYLSGTPWWSQMAIFITEDDAQGGVDHIDSHRTVLLVASPWARRNYVSHTNSSFPGLLKTVFRILGIPPLNLFDATASDLMDCFGSAPDPAPYRAIPIHKELFDPDRAREPVEPRPSPRMDDPREVRKSRQ